MSDAGVVGTLRGIGRGLVSLPSHMIEAVQSDDPVVRGEAIVDSFALLTGIGVGGYQIGKAIGSGTKLAIIETRSPAVGIQSNSRILAEGELGTDGIPPYQVIRGDAINYDQIIGGVPGRVLGEFDAMTPGKLPGAVAETFSGGRYAVVELDMPMVLHRAWAPGQSREFGGYWSMEVPRGSLQSRIDSALLPDWGRISYTPFRTQATNIVSVEIPAGTKLYVGEVGSQGSPWVGGKSQVLVEGGVNPVWKISEGMLP